MKTEDFVFFRRKELLPYLISFLVLITFSQIALELSFVQNSAITPLLVLNNPLFEIIGISSPFFLFIGIFVKRRSTKIDLSWMPPKKFLLYLFLFLISLIPLIFLYNTITPEVVPANTTTTTPALTETSASLSTTTSTTSTLPFQTQTSQINLAFFYEFRNFFILLILIIPLFFLFHRGTTIADKKDEDIIEEKEEAQKSNIKIRSILESYYQASNKLEERGADDTPSFTPFEFNIDVLNKKLSPSKTITQLTDLFEEAKFSSHKITRKQVEKARTLASDIIDEPDPFNEFLSTEDEKGVPQIKKKKEEEEE